MSQSFHTHSSTGKHLVNTSAITPSPSLDTTHSIGRTSYRLGIAGHKNICRRFYYPCPHIYSLLSLAFFVVIGVPHTPVLYANAHGVAVNRLFTYGAVSHYSPPS
jgi:hypothetical protein